MNLKRLLDRVSKREPRSVLSVPVSAPNGESPYNHLPPERFWRTGVVKADPLSISDLYHPKFELTQQDPIACAGSCFAQHISAQLRARNFNVIDKEPPPDGLTKESALRFGYGTFSARYANIYVVRQLLQLAKEALLKEPRSAREIVWMQDGRYFDALRPSVEPEGFATADEVLFHRAVHLQKVRELLLEMKVLVFTLGLTECWENTETGLVYPTCPGTIAGCFDSSAYRFRNLGFGEIYSDFIELKNLIQRRNPGVKFILTVSPVPLTATATSDHILVATTYSKSVLRAVAGALSNEFPEIDYFPSYEIITGPQAKGRFYERNLRVVTPEGVTAVMNTFFASRATVSDTAANVDPANPSTKADSEDDVVCEEALLEAFAKK